MPKHTTVCTVAAALMLSTLAGCRESPPDSPGPDIEKPLNMPGFRRIRYQRDLRPGTVLFDHKGTRFGIVRAYEPKHKYPDGQVDAGVQIQLFKNGGKRWLQIALVHVYYIVRDEAARPAPQR